MKNFILLIAMVLVFTGCEALNNTDDAAETTPQQTAETDNDTTTDTEDENADDEMASEDTEGTEDDEAATDVVEQTVTASNFSFSPSQITAEPGQTVRIQVNNEEGTHDLVIDEFDVSTPMMAEGQTEVIEFTVPEDAAGQTYEFYCSVGSHREMGMIGNIIVSE